MQVVPWLVLLALAAPIAVAFPCARFGWFSDCTLVMASPLPEQEKLEVVASMIDNVRGWNTAFGVTEPPVGTNVVNNGVVENDWVRIMAVMPSVYDGDVLVNPGYGEVVAKGAYTVRTPSGTEGGDCRTEYSLNHRSRLLQYLNGVSIGSGETATFSTDAQVMDLRADLVIDTDLTVGHYRWRRVSRRWRCLFVGNEVRSKSTVVSDSLQALRHQPEIPYSFKVQDQYFGITQIAFNASNYSWLRVQFNPHAFYEERLVEFEPFFRLEPYYTIHFRTYHNKTVSFEGLRFQNNTFQVTSTDGCRIQLADYFRTYTYPCPLGYTKVDLKISTDKNVYAPGETVLVSVDPGIPARITYGNSSWMAQGSTHMPAQSNVALIRAEAEGVESTKAIHVINPVLWQTAWGILGFLAVSYVFWRIIKKLAEGAYDLWDP